MAKNKDLEILTKAKLDETISENTIRAQLDKLSKKYLSKSNIKYKTFKNKRNVGKISAKVLQVKIAISSCTPETAAQLAFFTMTRTGLEPVTSTLSR